MRDVENSDSASASRTDRPSPCRFDLVDRVNLFPSSAMPDVANSGTHSPMRPGNPFHPCLHEAIHSIARTALPPMDPFGDPIESTAARYRENAWSKWLFAHSPIMRVERSSFGPFDSIEIWNPLEKFDAEGRNRIPLYL